MASFSSSRPRRSLRVLAPLACVVAVVCLAPVALADGAAQTSSSAAPTDRAPASVALEQCLLAPAQTERSATFTGEMTAIPGTARMQMRIDVLERLPHELLFHTVSAPGLGVWRSSATGVKVYRYLKQVTNLSAPASYRGAVSFRWLTARGRIIKTTELHTPKCAQPAAPPPPEGGSPETPSPPVPSAPTGGQPAASS